MNFLVRHRQRSANRNTAGDGAARSVPILHAYREGEIWIADSRRTRARGGIQLPVQKLRAERLGHVRGNIRAAAAYPGKYGPGASAQDKQQLLNAVMNIGTDCSAIIPESMMIDFIKADMHASIELFERFLEYTDKQVSKAVLGQTMTSDIPKSGGLGGAGAAKVHDMVRHDIADDDAKKLAAAWNRDLVKPIVDINLGPRKSYPQIIIGFPQDQDLAALEALGPLIDRGFKVPTKQIYSRLRLTAPDAGDEVLHPMEKISDRENPAGPAGRAR